VAQRYLNRKQINVDNKIAMIMTITVIIKVEIKVVLVQMKIMTELNNHNQ